MTYTKKQTKGAMVQSGCIILGLFFMVFPLTGQCQTNTAKQVKQAVEKSVQIHRKAQKQRDQWETEKLKLVLLYEQLQSEQDALLLEKHELTTAQKRQKALNQRLVKQKESALKIQQELFPFIKEVTAKLAMHVANDAPFLKKERSARMQRLEKVVHDRDISVAEKYRKVMETLFIEAEYGATLEVYQDKVQIGNETVLGNIFRLGRVSLFFLSLDQATCATFDVAQNHWQTLPEDYLPAIRSAVEIGNKRKPAALLALPLGRLAVKGDEQ